MVEKVEPIPFTTRQKVALTVAVLASFVSFLDSTIVTVALPAIETELGGGLSTQQWVMDAYLVTLGALILVAGSLSDVFGRIGVLRAGLIGFLVTSVAVGLAPSPLILIIARALQGVAGALLVPSSLALITVMFRAGRSRAIGIWTAATTVAMLIGPLLGGAAAEFLSWRLAFFINVLPIALTLPLLGRIGLREVRGKASSVDFLGAALCTLGLGGLVFALIEQPNLGIDSPIILTAGIAGIIALAAFLVRQHYARHPLMPLKLFRVRNFWAGNLATLFVYGALSLNGLALGLYLQEGAGLGATLAGLAMLPSTVIMILFSSQVGTWAGKLGARFFMTVGPLVMAGGMLLLLLVAEDFNYWWQVLPAVVAYGVGLTLTVAPLTAAVLADIDERISGVASAVNNAVARIAGLVATAFLGVIVGGSLDLPGFWRSVLVAGALFMLGAMASFAGIRRSRLEITANEDAVAGAGDGL